LFPLIVLFAIFMPVRGVDVYIPQGRYGRTGYSVGQFGV